MKVIVYAISKNEIQFVDRWYESMKEADDIYVLDTGSTDDTVDKLKSLGVHVKSEIIKPWRFDVARNKSLELVPLDTDICVCTDLDEVFLPGWRNSLEKSWHNANRLRYHYNWSIDKNDQPIISFWYEKIHDRKHYHWIYPVHEVLEFSGDKEVVSKDDNIVLNHYPDHTKSRSSYLPLLELAVKENPTNDRMMHYLGREYMYYKEWHKAIETLEKHLTLPTAKWKEERCASMRFIARSYRALNQPHEALYWLDKAILECPYMRDAYVEKSFLLYEEKKYHETIIELMKAKMILKNELIYINEPFSWDNTIDDILSICFYNIGLKDEALFYINKALEKEPDNERLLNNKEIFLK